MTETAPEADRVPGAPHPREATGLIGHDTAVADFIAAARAHRLHHGWLITGPRGTGKATLACRKVTENPAGKRTANQAGDRNGIQRRQLHP